MTGTFEPQAVVGARDYGRFPVQISIAARGERDLAEELTLEEVKHARLLFGRDAESHGHVGGLVKS